MEQVHPGIGKGGLTLTMTGQLKSSINARATEEGAEVGTNLVYAATHQFGASGRVIRAKNKPYLAFEYHGRTIRKKQVTVNIPARPFLGISDEDRQEIKSLVEEALSEA
ncbi:MAG: phage virion morphogenesis protein [Ruminococcus sp.]